MQYLYNIFLFIANAIIPLIALFNPKIKLFYQGRKETFYKLQNTISPADKSVWMHCASLGEFEQGRPVLEKIKLQYPNYKIVVSFFSPSGYEVRKNYDIADVVVYLPLDTKKKVAQFVKLIHPSLAIFVKYEFWPNILQELKRTKTPTILISGIFRKNQAFFREKGKWFRNSLTTFLHFFVQDEDSVSLLKKIGFSNATETGDTRFDRVYEIVNQKKELPLLDKFTNEQHTLVAGSTWPKDEEILIEYINKHASEDEKFIIAPHNIDTKEIQTISERIQKKVLLYSKATTNNIADKQVIIINSIGILTSVYSYANVAYVGGGFSAGIHNILEPATYGIPIIIGPNYQKFKEASELILAKGCLEVSDLKSLTFQLKEFYKNKQFTLATGTITSTYIGENIGATQKIMEYVTNVL